MPYAMIHLAAAMEYDSEAPAEFYIGNIAPDCISDWQQKDRLHLRGRADAGEAILEYAGELGCASAYHRGILLHLYLDYLWDGTVKKYRESHTGDSWITDYRREAKQTSSWLYHNLPWSERVWSLMENCPSDRYASIPDYPPELILEYMKRAHLSHKEQIDSPSESFPPDTVLAFARSAAEGFEDFLGAVRGG